MRHGLGSEHPLCDRIQLIFVILFFIVLGIDTLTFFMFGYSTVILAAVSFPALLIGMMSFLCISVSLLSIVIWNAFFIFYDRMATYEEKSLIDMLGEEYIAYQKRVSKWLPRLR